MYSNQKSFWRQVAALSALGFIGVLSALPIIPPLIAASGQEPPLPMAAILAISTMQSTLLLVVMVALGTWLAGKVNLHAPIVEAWAKGHRQVPAIASWVKVAVVAGIVGGTGLLIIGLLALPYLPDAFVASAKAFAPPLYTRLFYGGVTEELLIRWGLMSVFVWGLFKLTPGAKSHPHSWHYIFAIALSALAFAAGHLPAAQLLAGQLTWPLVAYIMLGNGFFGVIAGWLYWRFGLESAILAHMLAHVVMATGQSLL